MNIVYGKKNVIVSARTRIGKSLISQMVILINPRAIILIIKDQKRELKQKGINTLAFIATVIKANLNIWK